MKRLAVIVKPENVDDITSSLKTLGLEATIYDVKRASKEKERVTTNKGMGTMIASYSTRKVVATVVNSDVMEEVVSAMKKALAGEKAVVMISSVDDLVMI
jgi:nitrogen regulatory protein PII